MRSATPVTGTVWAVFDPGAELYRYQCHLSGGLVEDHLLERARARSGTEAVASVLAWAPSPSPGAAGIVRPALVPGPGHCSERLVAA